MAQTVQLKPFDVIENEAQRIFVLQRAAYLRHPYPSAEERIDRRHSFGRAAANVFEAGLPLLDKKSDVLKPGMTSVVPSGLCWLHDEPFR